MIKSPTIDEAIALAIVHRMCHDGTARRLRLACGLSLRAVGDACGADQSTVYRVEMTERTGRADHRTVAYAALLGQLLELEAGS